MKFFAVTVALAVLATPAVAQTKPDQADSTPATTTTMTKTTHVHMATHTMRHHGAMKKSWHHSKCCNCSCKSMHHHWKHHGTMKHMGHHTMVKAKTTTTTTTTKSK